MISDINIIDINHVQEILNDIRNYVKAYENQIGELSEDVCENIGFQLAEIDGFIICLLYTSPSPRDPKTSRMPSSA